MSSAPAANTRRTDHAVELVGGVDGDAHRSPEGGRIDVLLLCRFGALAAATRVRFLQYLPYLAEHGVYVDVAPLLDDVALAELYSGGRRSPLHYGAGYAGRVREVARAARRRYDVVWCYFELFPGLPAAGERLLQARGVPLVVDYDDAAFHYYDRNPSPVVRRLLGRKIDAVMRGATVVVAGNRYIADRARAAGAADVEVVPTVVDPRDYADPAGPGAPGAAPVDDRPFTIGWIGSPPTARHLDEAWEPLRRFVAAHPDTRVVLVGLTAPPPGAPPGVEVRPWRQGAEGAELARFDVGIMPLPDQPFERGKCGYKLVQYFAAGVPAVASPVGVNTELVTPGVTGFTAATPDEWVQALEALRADAGLRRRLGAAGRRLVEQRYSLEVTAPQILGVLRRAAGRRTAAGSRAATLP